MPTPERLDGPAPRNRAERRARARRLGKKAFALASGTSIVATGLGLVTATPAGASTFTVTNGNDSGAGSLRAAISAANGNAGPDVITFSGSVNDIQISSGELSITDSLTISGPGAGALTIHPDAATTNGGDRLFYVVRAGTLTISGATIEDFDSSAKGAALYAAGTDVTLDDVTLSGNHSGQNGGALYFAGHLYVSYGVYTANDLTITDSTIEGSSADHGYGGAVFLRTGGTVTVSGDTTFSDNRSNYKSGGAIYANLYDGATFDISGATFDGNSAAHGAGAVFVSNRSNADADVSIADSTFTSNSADGGQGGALQAFGYGETDFTVSITGSTFSDNSADQGGGAIQMELYSIGSSITDTTFDHNHAVGNGGGLYLSLQDRGAVDVTTSTFSDNDSSDDRGGGIAADLRGDSTLEIHRSLVTGNAATTGSGGGVYATISDQTSMTIQDSSIDGNSAVDAGGVRLGTYYDGSAVIDRTTISNNTATAYGVGGLYVAGNRGSDDVETEVSISSSTISSNTAQTSGGGVAFAGDADATISSSTITGNTAASGGGMLLYSSSHHSSYTGDSGGGPTVTMTHSIVSGNVADDDADVAMRDRLSGGVVVPFHPATLDATWSLIGDPGDADVVDGQDGNVVGADAMLGALAVNNSTAPVVGAPPIGTDTRTPTRTNLPAAGSPAIDAGDPNVADAPATDQRGLARISHNIIDIGAVEVQAATPAPAPDAAPPPTSTVVTEPAGQDGTADVTVRTPAGDITVQVAGVDPGKTVTVTVHEVSVDDAGVDTKGFQVQGKLYEVEVSDTGSGGARICLPYDSSDTGLGSVTIIHFTADGTREALDTTIAGDQVCATTTSFSPFAVAVLSTSRLAGTDAAATAAAISASHFSPGVPVVYVASRDAVSDAIAAGAAGAPLLLVHRDSIPAATSAELERLDAQRIVVVGGTSAVSDAVVASLGATRVAGADRYETTAAIARDHFSSGAPVVYVANGASVPDGLVAAAAASREGGAVLLVQRDAIPTATADALAAIKPAKVIVVGGSAAVSDAVVRSLGATREAGADRYVTAAAVATASGGRRLIVARGDDPIDALAGSSLGLPLILVRTNDVPDAASSALTTLAPRAITVLGGTAAVSTQTELDLAGFVTPA